MFWAKQPRLQSSSWVFAARGTRKFIAVCELPNNMRVNACIVPDSHGSSLLSKTMPNAFRRPAVLWANFRAFPRHITRTLSFCTFGKLCLHLFGAPFFRQAAIGNRHFCTMFHGCQWICWWLILFWAARRYWWMKRLASANACFGSTAFTQGLAALSSVRNSGH